MLMMLTPSRPSLANTTTTTPLMFTPTAIQTYWSASNPKPASGDLAIPSGTTFVPYNFPAGRWQPGSQLGTITGQPGRGSTQIKVNPASAVAGLKPGDAILVEMADSASTAGAMDKYLMGTTDLP